MKKIFSAIAVLTAFATAAVSCSDDDTKDDEKIPVAEVKVTPATGSVVAGTTLTLKAEILPENASDKTVEWRSRTPEIATGDPETGVVTGVPEGEAEILALCGGKNGKAVIGRRDCIKCFCCQELCPKHAIEVKKNFIFKLAH